VQTALLLAPVVAENLPAAQPLHEPEPSELNLPAEHVTQELLKGMLPL